MSTEERTAFKAPSSRKNDVYRLSPPHIHLVAYMTGGVQKLYHQIKLDCVEPIHDFGRYTDENGCFCPKNVLPLLACRYRVLEIIGKGQSSVLLKAVDTFNNERPVSIKVLHTGYKILGIQESNCLRRINTADPYKVASTLQLLTTFTFDDHHCIVMEYLQPAPLTDYFMTMTHTQALKSIRQVSLKLLQALGFLKQQNIIHADLKPENVLLANKNDMSSLKVVDFGNAIRCVHDEVSLYYEDFELQTLLYRAPEVMFGQPFGVEIDMWSLGCILAELFLKQPIFFGKNKEEILQQMVSVLGPFPRDVFQRGKFYRELTDFTSKTLLSQRVAMLNIHRKIESLTGYANADFVDFLLGMLQYDPSKRFTPSQAALHPFLAPEMALRFLLPTTPSDGIGSYQGVALRAEVYSNQPAINSDLKFQHLSSLELLKLGTGSTEVSEDLKVKQVAEVVPVIRDIPAANRPQQNYSTSTDVSRTRSARLTTGTSQHDSMNLTQETTAQDSISVLGEIDITKFAGANVTFGEIRSMNTLQKIMQLIRVEQDTVEQDMKRKDNVNTPTDQRACVEKTLKNHREDVERRDVDKDFGSKHKCVERSRIDPWSGSNSVGYKVITEGNINTEHSKPTGNVKSEETEDVRARVESVNTYPVSSVNSNTHLHKRDHHLSTNLLAHSHKQDRIAADVRENQNIPSCSLTSEFSSDRKRHLSVPHSPCPMPPKKKWHQDAFVSDHNNSTDESMSRTNESKHTSSEDRDIVSVNTDVRSKACRSLTKPLDAITVQMHNSTSRVNKAQQKTFHPKKAWHHLHDALWKNNASGDPLPTEKNDLILDIAEIGLKSDASTSLNTFADQPEKMDRKLVHPDGKSKLSAFFSAVHENALISSSVSKPSHEECQYKTSSPLTDISDSGIHRKITENPAETRMCSADSSLYSSDDNEASSTQCSSNDEVAILDSVSGTDNTVVALGPEETLIQSQTQPQSSDKEEQREVLILTPEFKTLGRGEKLAFRQALQAQDVNGNSNISTPLTKTKFLGKHKAADTSVSRSSPRIMTSLSDEGLKTKSRKYSLNHEEMAGSSSAEQHYVSGKVQDQENICHSTVPEQQRKSPRNKRQSNTPAASLRRSPRSKKENLLRNNNSSDLNSLSKVSKESKGVSGPNNVKEYVVVPPTVEKNLEKVMDSSKKRKHGNSTPTKVAHTPKRGISIYDFEEEPSPNCVSSKTNPIFHVPQKPQKLIKQSLTQKLDHFQNNLKNSRTAEKSSQSKHIRPKYQKPLVQTDSQGIDIADNDPSVLSMDWSVTAGNITPALMKRRKKESVSMPVTSTPVIKKTVRRKSLEKINVTKHALPVTSTPVISKYINNTAEVQQRATARSGDDNKQTEPRFAKHTKKNKYGDIISNDIEYDRGKGEEDGANNAKSSSCVTSTKDVRKSRSSKASSNHTVIYDYSSDSSDSGEVNKTKRSFIRSQVRKQTQAPSPRKDMRINHGTPSQTFRSLKGKISQNVNKHGNGKDKERDFGFEDSVLLL